MYLFTYKIETKNEKLMVMEACLLITSLSSCSSSPDRFQQKTHELEYIDEGYEKQSGVAKNSYRELKGYFAP